MSEGSANTPANDGHDLPAPLLELDRRIAAAVEDRLSAIRTQLENRLRSSGQALLDAAGDLTLELPERYLDAADVATFAAAGATPAVAGSEAVLASVARVDRARTQPDLLSVLLEEARRFASRSAFFLTRPDGVHGWSSRGFGSLERPIDDVAFAYSDEMWSSLAQGHGPVTLGAHACARLAEQLGTATAGRGALVPFVLRGKLAGALYADQVDATDDELDMAALQLLVHAAALSLETLALREDAGSPTLRGASADRDATADSMGLWGAAAAAGAAAATLTHDAVSDESEDSFDAPTADVEPPAVESEPEVEPLAVESEPAVEPPASEPEPAAVESARVDETDSASEASSIEAETEVAPPVSVTIEADEDDGPETLELETGESEDDLFEDDDETPEPAVEDTETSGEANAVTTSEALDLSDTRPGALDAGATTTAAPAEVWEDEEPTVETQFRARPADEPTPPTNDDTRATDVPDFQLDYPDERVTETVRRPRIDPNEDATMVASRGSMITPPDVEPSPEVSAPEPVEPEPVASVLPSASEGKSASRSASEVVPPMDIDGPGSAFATASSPAPAQGPASAVPEGEEALHEEAKRLARLLVSEIKLYNEEVIEEGRREGNIYARLKEDIDRSRQMYDERIDPRLREGTDYFVDELVQRLAGGDASVLGL